MWDSRYILPWWLRRQSVCLECGRPGFDPWVGKIPWRRKWQPTPVLLPGKSHGQRSLVGYSPWGRRVGHNWATPSPPLGTYILDCLMFFHRSLILFIFQGFIFLFVFLDIFCFYVFKFTNVLWCLISWSYIFFISRILFFTSNSLICIFSCLLFLLLVCTQFSIIHLNIWNIFIIAFLLFLFSNSIICVKFSSISTNWFLFSS